MRKERKALIDLRVDILKKMDNFIRTEIDDEYIFYNMWLAEGVPDEASIEDLIFIAEDEDNWDDVMRCFRNCCRLARVI